MGQYAVVTGASKGIGRSIAFELAKRKFNLILIARSKEELLKLKAVLAEAHGVEIEVFAIDLSEQGAALAVSRFLSSLSVSVSILVNNAGYGIWGKFDSLPIEQQLNMLQLNINAVVELTYHVMPLLKAQKASYILNVSSTAAYQALPTLSLYAASKAFVLSFSRSLRFELLNSPVSVTCLSPGPVDTGFAQRAGLGALSKLADKFNMHPDEVARIAVKEMFRKRAEVIPGFTNIISAFATRVLPKSFIEKTAAGIYKV